MEAYGGRLAGRCPGGDLSADELDQVVTDACVQEGSQEALGGAFVFSGAPE